jgi:hypothetical protein
LQYIKYTIIAFTPSIILLYFLPACPPVPGISSTDAMILSTCVHSICSIFALPQPFSTFSPLPLVPGRTCSALLFSDFVKEKK